MRPVYYSNQCKGANIQENSPFLLIAPKGESIRDAIMKCVNDAELSAATVHGIGALENPTIAYFNREAKKYEEHLFEGVFELVSFIGNITWVDDKRFLHAHVALGNEKCEMMGGHLVDGIVGVTAELTITPLSGKVSRSYHGDIGLCLIDPNVA